MEVVAQGVSLRQSGKGHTRVGSGTDPGQTPVRDTTDAARPWARVASEVTVSCGGGDSGGMDLSKTVAAMALLLAGILIGGYSRAYGQTAGQTAGQVTAAQETAPRTSAAREAARQMALAEHQRRKQDFARLCAKPLKTNTEMDACRAAYQRL